MKEFCKKIFVMLAMSLMVALFLTSCQNRCKEYEKVYDGFPYHNGELLKFRVSDSILTSQVAGIAVDVNKGRPSGCNYSNTATWVLKDSAGSIPFVFVMSGHGGYYEMIISSPFLSGTDQNSFNPTKLITLTIGGYSYNDIFDPSKAFSSGNDSTWFSRSKGLVKLKYKGKTYERVL